MNYCLSPHLEGSDQSVSGSHANNYCNQYLGAPVNEVNAHDLMM
jgi:hypothetical protein